jgi:hypothetical protein
MFKLDLSAAICLYLSISIVGLFVGWLFLERRGAFKRYTRDEEYIWQCSICSHTYVDSKHELLSLCPVCKSYNKKGG